MASLDLSKVLPVDVSCFLAITSLQLDRLSGMDDTLPGELQEFNGIGFAQYNVSLDFPPFLRFNFSSDSFSFNRRSVTSKPTLLCPRPRLPRKKNSPRPLDSTLPLPLILKKIPSRLPRSARPRTFLRTPTSMPPVRTTTKTPARPGKPLSTLSLHYF